MDDLEFDLDAQRAQRAGALAEALLVAAHAHESRAERRRRRQLHQLVADPDSRAFLIALTDEVLRIASPARAARRFRDLVVTDGTPRFAGPMDKLALAVGGRLAPLAPSLVMGLVKRRLRRELASVVLAAEARPLARHIARRKAQRVDLNLNLLGEAVLGASEAAERAAQVIELLGRDDVDYVSVKISSICAQIDVLAYEDSLARIVEALRPIYAAASRFTPAKFVNLDMEEYQDLWLTLDAFTTVLCEPAFEALEAGIVLQAYLPDSLAAMERLVAFARERHRRSGARTKVRIVKGANLAMEAVEAELRGYEQAPYGAKREVDAHYKTLLDVALQPAGEGALRVGVASHNLFDVAWALTVAAETGAGGRIEIEMLEGMANAQAYAVREYAGSILLYAPIVPEQRFDSAVAYLVRRFDENAAPENFLAQGFDLAPGSASFARERARFEEAVSERRDVSSEARRRQDRSLEEKEAAPESWPAAPAFVNEADTDFSLARNRAWVQGHLSSWRALLEDVPAVVASAWVHSPLSGSAVDPSSPGSVLYRYVEADRETVEQAIATARAAAPTWHGLGALARRERLWQAAHVLGAGRGPTIAIMSHDAGKTVAEADAEISEAIDLARYYGDQAMLLDAHERARFVPYRVVVVTPPWNFPYAIPAGGILAALAAGAAVIVKPAPQSVWCAWRLVSQLWEAGIPTDVLQFVPSAEDEAGRLLVTSPDVDAVILTGAFDTARLFLSWRPTLALHAETSGKNALVVTAAADRDEAIADLVRSAFSHSGQKCSAASLAILEAELYDDRRFLARLADVVNSLRVGPAWDRSTQVGPLIAPPSGALERALSTLEPGESWLVQPSQVGDNAHLWRPGVKLGVERGSFFHLHECFGPVLGLMRASDLDEAIELQNQPAYGLTGGIHSLDEREVETWLQRVEVGNAYVNRHITGAIVRRQPFGGWKRSAVGAGAKAGGPSYVASLGRIELTAQVDVEREVADALALFAALAPGEDPTGLSCEANVLRLCPRSPVALRLSSPIEPFALAVSLGIAAALRIELEVSAPILLHGMLAHSVLEDDEGFLARMRRRPLAFIRLLGAPVSLRLALLELPCELEVRDPVALGVVELSRWTREQAISETRHRHGSLRDPRS